MLSARCACGGLVVGLTGAPIAHVLCHCDNCKQRTGSAFGIGAYFLKRNVVHIVGETSVYRVHNPQRREHQERHFCRRCGSTVYWYTTAYPGTIGVAGGCFAPETIGEPDMSASSSRRLPWVGLPAHWHYAP
jgi:hypothetical protein